MKAKLTLVASALLLAFGCATDKDTTTASSAAPNVLLAAKVSTPPTLDGNPNDAVWARAKPLAVKLSGGANFGGTGETTATLKAVYTADTIYFLVQYNDPTNSIRRGPFQKQANGTWTKLKDPKDTGGDDNVYYEDKWAMIWNINNSIAGFNENGCSVMCHAGEPGKPYGNKYTAKEGEIGDIWHMKGSRTAPLGNVDDQYVDHTRFDPKTNPNAGRKSDPGGPEYKGFGLVNGKPEFMSKNGKAANGGGTFYIVDADKVAFDDARFKTGDEVASFLIYPLKGDRADIKVANRWANGVMTSEVSRKLVTGSKFDVQFGDLNAQYAFGFAAFDNAQVRHAVHYDALQLRFAK
ncbi:MAG TPA: ethylbenzene dehydrogenase-related protein [Burkholderiales bacterium]|jgi:hypothetical protein|nr:ethylbenzene dehydrogenase-related protein [Burkholderiales bacterium]